MRLVAGISMIAHASLGLQSGPSVLSILWIALGTLLIPGLWTPIAGLLTAVLAMWNTISQPGDRWACILLATIGAALAFVGPGAWSLDARIFGWTRIEIRGRKS
jgi:putative oxidoreductase